LDKQDLQIQVAVVEAVDPADQPEEQEAQV
jgi:hypothetical protein